MEYFACCVKFDATNFSCKGRNARNRNEVLYHYPIADTHSAEYPTFHAVICNYFLKNCKEFHKLVASVANFRFFVRVFACINYPKTRPAYKFRTVAESSFNDLAVYEEFLTAQYYFINIFHRLPSKSLYKTYRRIEPGT